ncbi:tetratricopeptide repeat protein [Winogradskyella haliclonae]|uniref:Tetratricopeptide repeat protein n=1 Tax=Winogradskyella haliclonae TaxID=2048558 RepID=A0ABQ2BWY2_9FLAO|nr:hypothetical protein [Winogradskyella haliclonae]GGI57004.1 hypothetical protein GCM10011444_13130 [Winogradskyella haliclonae]
MKRFFYLIQFLLISGIAFAQNKNYGYISKYKTITHELLSMEERAFKQTDINYQKMYKLIDSIIDYTTQKIQKIKLETSLKNKQRALKILHTIDQSLTEFDFITYYTIERLNQALIKVEIKKENINLFEQKDRRDGNQTIYFFDYYRHSDDDSGAICMTKNRREYFYNSESNKFYRSDCDLTAFIYLGIAQVNNLPMYLVEVPKHNFIRYQINENSFINWDNNSANTFSNEDFRNGLSPTVSTQFNLEDEKKYGYLKNMTHKEVIGYHYENVARYSIENNEYEKAIEQLKLAVKNRPYSKYASEDLSSLYHSIGYKNIQERNYANSILNFQEALKINDTMQYANDNLGYALIRMNRLDEGKKFIDISIKLGNNNPAYSSRNLGLYCFYKNDFDCSKEHYLDAFNLAKKYVDFLDYHYAELLLKLGKLDKAIEHLKIAAEKGEFDAKEKLNDLTKN